MRPNLCDYEKTSGVAKPRPSKLELNILRAKRPNCTKARTFSGTPTNVQI